MFGRLQSRIEGAIAGHGGPTTDLYFVNACRDAIEDGRAERLSATCFASKDAVLVLRHGAGADLGAHRDKPVIWFCDDDVPAAIRDPGLGWDARAKLLLAERWRLATVRSRLGAVVVSTPRLTDMARGIARGAEIATLSPHWDAPFPSLDHFDDRQAIDIACLGALTHRADFSLVWEALETVLARAPSARVWIAANHDVPPALRDHPRLRRIEETSWVDYRRTMGGRRFHIALYPLLDTAMNRARSVNKIIEHGLFGAASLYSLDWPETERVLTAGAGRGVPGTAAAWTEALLDLAADVSSGGGAAAAIAARGQALAQALNDPAPQRALWTRLMNL